MTLPSDAFRLLRAAPGPRLVMFPRSGSGALSMADWAGDLPVNIECCAIQRPGREELFAEPPTTSLRSCVVAACDALMPRLDRPYVLFGHSLGGFLAFQVAVELRARGARPPVALFLSAISPVVESHARQASRAARHLQVRSVITAADLDDDELIEDLLRSGDAAFEADLSLYFDSNEEASDAVLDLPIVAIYARDDDIAPREAVLRWGARTSIPLETLEVDGGHLYVSTAARRPVADAIARVLLDLPKLDRLVQVP